MKKILILNGQYAPGYKGGGPIQSCINMVENLSNKYKFYVICADRDYKSMEPYGDINVNEWNHVGTASVYYMSPDKQSFSGFKEVLNSINYNVLYLNGFFSPIYTIRPLILRLMRSLKNDGKVIITPRGDFTGGCENKKIKKHMYINICKAMGLYSKLTWHATSEIEENDIKNKFPNAKTFVVPNLPGSFKEQTSIIGKRTGELRLVFVSRIFPKKNLKFALEILKKISVGNIIFDIYGPMEDKKYWRECEGIIQHMPKNIKVSYKGEVSHNKIAQVFKQYHSFIFPTLGENYGHVIVEAMMNNCICILSKGVTPWDDYGDNGGFTIQLGNIQGFIEAIKCLLDMNSEELKIRIKSNNDYVAKKIDCKKDIALYEQMMGNL